MNPKLFFFFVAICLFLHFFLSPNCDTFACGTHRFWSLPCDHGLLGLYRSWQCLSYSLCVKMPPGSRLGLRPLVIDLKERECLCGERFISNKPWPLRCIHLQGQHSRISPVSCRCVAAVGISWADLCWRLGCELPALLSDGEDTLPIPLLACPHVPDSPDSHCITASQLSSLQVCNFYR